MEHFSAFFPDLYSHQTNADIPLFQQVFLKSINLRPANFIQPVRELFLIYLSWTHGNYPAACASKRRNYQAFTTTPNARFWHIAAICNTRQAAMSEKRTVMTAFFLNQRRG
ncbi:hypothetical protein, partial [Escherichia coli]|uniref:hypothetical protein n=1 Tax=Escherichia coli TaxID=562 RepID=UPI0039938BAB